MKLLFLTHPYPNYVPDLLLHGLRKLIGPDSRRLSAQRLRLRRGLGPGGLSPQSALPRVVSAGRRRGRPRGHSAQDPQRVFRLRGLRRAGLADSGSKPSVRLRRPLAVIDGEDRPVPGQPRRGVLFRRETDGSDGSIPLPMSLPEEIFNWIAAYDGQPKRYSDRLPGQHPGRRPPGAHRAAGGAISGRPFQRFGRALGAQPFPAGALRPRRVLPRAAGLPGRALAAGRRVRHLPVLGERRLQRRSPRPAVPDPHPGRFLRRGGHPAVQRHRGHPAPARCGSERG